MLAEVNVLVYTSLVVYLARQVRDRSKPWMSSSSAGRVT